MARTFNYPNPVLADRLNQLFKIDNYYTDPEIADRIGCERKAVMAWRNCVYSPNVIYLRRICACYNVSADWLLGLSDKKEITRK